MAGRDAVGLYRALALHRAAAARLTGLRDQGLVPAPTRCGSGYEAVSAGAARALRTAEDGTGDVIAPTPDNPGAFFVFGGTPLEFFRQRLARDSSPSRGREPGLCPADFERGLVGSAALPGTMVEVMAGITLAFRLRDQDRVGLVFSGEDESSTSAWHEGINFAAVQRCPLIVLVQSGTEASLGAHTRARGFGPKAAGYGVASASVAGGDVLAVHGAVLAAAERARSGKGATLIETRGCPVARRVRRVIPGHRERHPDQGQADPAARFRARLVGERIVRASDLDALERGARAEVRAACEQALGESSPCEEHALGGVYDGDAGTPPWYRLDPPERGLAPASATWPEAGR